MKKLLLSLLLSMSCTTGNIVFQDTNFGDQTDVQKTNTARQSSIIQKMDKMRDMKIQMTPELKREIDRGKEDARKFMEDAGNFESDLKSTVSIDPHLNDILRLAKNNGLGYRIVQVSYSNFYQKNKRIHTCRQEIRWVTEQAWKMGLRFLVVECHRSKERQLALYNKGASQLKFGMHNYDPSHAIDFVPVHLKTGKLMWEGGDALRQYAYSIGVFQTLTEIGIEKFGWKVYFRSGRDWKRTNTVYQPSTLHDWAHWEIRDKKKKVTTYIHSLWRKYEKDRALYVFESSGKIRVPRSFPKEYLVRQVALLPGRELVYESLVQGPKSRPRFPYGKNY